MNVEIFDYLLVAIFGALIGLTELLSRYRDAPFKAIRSWQAFTYIAVNVAASLSALWLLRTFDLTFGFEGNPQQIRWVQVLVAGLGAMVIFRSSIFNIRVGDKDVSIGPSSILQVLLEVLDREVDRKRAQQRAEAVETIIGKVQFGEIKDPLPIIAFALMQNLPMEDQDDLLNKISRLSEASVPPHTKSIAMGLALMDFIGEEVLTAALELVKKGEEEADLNEIAGTIFGPLLSSTEGNPGSNPNSTDSNPNSED